MARRIRPQLESPAGEAVCRLALGLLEEAQRAAARLQGGDPEALHDFRVAIRRLRTLLRAYRGLKPVAGKWQSRLRRLARATNGARDLEVAARQLRGLAEQEPLAAALADRLAARAEAVRTETLAAVTGEWPRLAAGVREALLRRRGTSGQTFGEFTACLVQRQWRRLARRLQALQEEWHDDTAHRARLAGKRLRYLLEPLAGTLPEAAPAVNALRKFQDRFGEYHDGWVLLGLIAEEAAADAADAAHARVFGMPAAGNPIPYAELAERVRAARAHEAGQLRRAYLAPKARTLAAVVRAVDVLKN